jgi:hypothetical protein
MPHFVRLQILPAAPAPLVALHSSGAQVADVPAQPLVLPSSPPTCTDSLRDALPTPVRLAFAQLVYAPSDAPLMLWLDVQVL